MAEEKDEVAAGENEDDNILVTVPAQVSVDKSAKGQIVAGVKAVLTHLAETGKIEEMTFDDMLNTPQKLQAFLDIFSTDRDALGGLIKDSAGNPVLDDDTLTEWGVTLPQIERLLVSTCARRYFIEIDGQIVVKTAKKEVRSMMVFKKTVTEKKKVKSNPGTAKFNQIKGILAFGWQLPLLAFYRDELPSRYIMALGEDLLYVRSVENLQHLVAYDSENLRKLKDKLKDLFVHALYHNPKALAGCAVWRIDLIQTFVKHMGKDAWVFLARDKQFFDHCADLDTPRIEILGSFLAYIGEKNLISMLRLDLDRMKGTVGAFELNFGTQTHMVIAEETLDEKFLAKLVDNFIHLETKENSQFVAAAESAVKALRDDILDYVQSQQG